MRRIAAAGLAATAAATLAGTATAATSGSISGPITSVSGNVFVVKTKLSPTGKSKVKVTAKTMIREQAAATRSDVKKGECASAMGTKKGTSLTAFRVSLAPAVKGSCTFGARRPRNGTRPPGTRAPRNGGSGFTPPANFGFAFGLVSAVKGSKVTVKGQAGSTNVVLGSKTQYSKTETLAPSAIDKSLCAFVFGTSSDGGKTVAAQSVQLTPSQNGSCTFFGRRTR